MLSDRQSSAGRERESERPFRRKASGPHSGHGSLAFERGERQSERHSHSEWNEQRNSHLHENDLWRLTMRSTEHEPAAPDSRQPIRRMNSTDSAACIPACVTAPRKRMSGFNEQLPAVTNPAQFRISHRLERSSTRLARRKSI